MADLLLVRHAEAIITRSDPPDRWPLSPAGERAAADLARRLDPIVGGRPTCLVASDEHKAVETAAQLGLGEPETDPRLREVGKVWYDSGADHRAAVVSFLGGADVPGWESRRAAQERFDEALRERAEDLTVVVSHGTIMSLWLSHRLDGFDAAEFWLRLSFPDAYVVSGFGDPERPPAVTRIA